MEFKLYLIVLGEVMLGIVGVSLALAIGVSAIRGALK